MAVTPNWALGAGAGDFASAALTGYDAGRQIGKQRRLDVALGTFAKDPEAGIAAAEAFDPALSERLRGLYTDRLTREAMQPQTSKGGDPSVAAGPTDLMSGSDLVAQHPRTDGINLNPQALDELYRFNPVAARDLQKAVYGANKDQFERLSEAGSVMGRTAEYLASLPAEQRAAALAQQAPRLEAAGISRDQLAKADLSDAGLAQYSKLGRLYGEVAKPSSKVGDYEYFNSIGRPDLAEAAADPFRTFTGPDGTVYARGGGMSRGGAPSGGAPAVGAVEDGYRFKGGDPGNSANWEAVGGAAPQGAATFP